MAISDKFTRAQLRAMLRREIMDPNGRWWDNSELNFYIDDWQDRIQQEHEFVFGSATITQTGSATITLTDVGTDILRVHDIYWDNRKLVPIDKQNLEIIDRAWRAFGTTTTPQLVVQDNDDTITIWPPPASTKVGTMIFEYPRELDFATDTSAMEIPAWTKYSVRNYGGWRCYLRRGPNHDANKAGRYRQSFYNQLGEFGTRKRNYFPKFAPAFRPGSLYESDILDPLISVTNLTLPSNVVTTLFEEEVPTGTINGTNVTFTLTQTPDPAKSLELELDRVTLVKDTDFTLSGATITMTFPPFTAQTLFARYRYTT